MTDVLALEWGYLDASGVVIIPDNADSEIYEQVKQDNCLIFQTEQS